MTISHKYRPRLVIMLKEPRVGRVKTRLGRDIGMIRATWWFRHQMQNLTRRLHDPRWEMVLAVAPDTAAAGSRALPPHIPRIAQGQGDLGNRMAHIFKSMPAGPICIIGADIPDITRPAIASAFKSLGANDAVFGPAPDGGYWLIGLKRSSALPPTIFQNTRWSTKHALKDTLRSIPSLKTTFIHSLNDVDTGADL